mmetsp:Transcript_26635/g.37526  ORF Transcript_26635/g.37526 Transcript_26635/m.37526 type:complete len:434 (+) Transcript_26635:155-1456(+)
MIVYKGIINKQLSISSMSLRKNISSVFLMAYMLVIILPAQRYALSTMTSTTTITKPFRHPHPKTIPTADQLRDLSKAISVKKPYSTNFFKSWKHWSRLGVNRVRHELSENLPCPVDQEKSCDLQFQLGVAADMGSMPSFEDPGARAGYAMDFFCRAILMADLLYIPKEPNTNDGGHSSLSFMDQGLQELFQRRQDVYVSSIGGGPGYDFVSAALVASFQNSLATQRGETTSITTSVHATIMDYEEGWYDLVDVMSEATRTALSFDEDVDHTCIFGGKCDITQSLSHESNAACLAEIQRTNLWICQYCVAENAAKLSQSDFIFFTDLFTMASEGTMFLFTETTHRLWPEFTEMILSLQQEQQDNDPCCGYEVAFPKVNGRGKGGHQMFIQKRKGAEISKEQLELCDEFIRDREMHKLKVKNGFVRQMKKIRGSK